jgi:hypothetical protein
VKTRGGFSFATSSGFSFPGISGLPSIILGRAI